LLRRFVVTESPSFEKAPMDRCCAVIAKAWRRLPGARIERIAQRQRGDHLRITWGPTKARPTGQLLVLGHYDTVYSSGTLRRCRFAFPQAELTAPAPST